MDRHAFSTHAQAHSPLHIETCLEACREQCNRIVSDGSCTPCSRGLATQGDCRLGKAEGEAMGLASAMIKPSIEASRGVSSWQSPCIRSVL